MADENNGPVPTEDQEGRTSDPDVKEGDAVEGEEQVQADAPTEETPVIIDGDDTAGVAVADDPDAKGPEPEEEMTDVDKPSTPEQGEQMPVGVKKEVMPLFDSKGSLVASESYAKERLDELKEKRAVFASLISDLQAKVQAFKTKDNPTDADVASLKKHHTLFLKRMSEYEEMTREVERLMGMTEVRSSQINIADIKPKTPEKLPPHDVSKGMESIEEKLPKVIVCGTDMEDSIPRIIVCEPLSKAHTEPFYGHGQSIKPERLDKGDSIECKDFVNEKIKETHAAQQKLATENHEINQMQLKIQQELFAKQGLLDNMKQQMLAYESDNYRIQNENVDLQRKLTMSGQLFGEGKICKRELYLKFRGESPDSQFCGVDNLQNFDYGLEKEGDYPVSQRRPVCKRELPQKSTQTDEDKEQNIFFESDKEPKYRELREQYQRLHSDFKNKVAEVASLRVDLDNTRTELNDITILHHELEAKHQKELENNSALLAVHMNQSSKDRTLDLEQAANFARQMYSTTNEELEGMKALIEDLQTQVDEYRNKYMNTLQIAEELKKANEFLEIEYENKIAIEIQKMKLEMQDHLKELVPIKELLKVTQQKLKETEQMHKIALETVAQLSQKLETALKELEMTRLQMENSGTSPEVVDNLQHSLEVAEKKLTELENENSRLKETIIQLEQLQSEQNQLLEKKSHEVQMLTTQLDTLREESARQVSRLKERNEMIRKCLQAQIAEMEEEVARCRAETSCANKERDKIRSKLQLDICLLSENLRESQNRILQLQQHLNYLSASHPTVFIDLCKESME